METQVLSDQTVAVDHCKHGHEFTPDNTHIADNGRRSCRACARQRNRAYAGRDQMPTSFSTFEFDNRHAVTEPRPVVCCARCARGTKQYTTNPVCGFNGRCKCHE